ncbi:RIB43A-like with coiled-coils protein 2 [Pholidichthys leucotaenia]
MLNAGTASDRLARASLDRRRNREAERKERIFNDKMRTIGVDKEALNMQVKEKKEQEEALKREQSAQDADMLHNTKVACILYNKQVKVKCEMEKAMVNYRDQHQQPRNRREYDLNDPDRIRKIDQGDAELMLPGLVGEDVESKSRVQRQREQLREWLIQQQRERAMEKHQETLEERHYDQSRMEMNNKLEQLHSLEMEKRKLVAIATKNYNLAKIEEKQIGESNNKESFLQDECTLSLVGVPGPSPSNMRPRESLQQVLQFHKQQMEEKKRAELEKRQEEEWYERVRVDSARAALLLERQQARLNRQLRQDLDSTNIKLADTHKKEKQEIERGYIDDSFFSKFNTCSR